MSDKNELKDAKKPKKDKGEKRKFRRTREMWSELKKVTWPTAGTVVKSTGVVLLVVAMFLVVLLIFDILLRVFVFGPLYDGELGDPFGLGSKLAPMLGSIKSMGSTALNAAKTTFGRTLWL